MVKIKQDVPYTCFRCGYNTCIKNGMRKHLNRKTMCPNINNCELTDNIKQTILDNRIYHAPKVSKITHVFNNHVTNNHTMNQSNTVIQINEVPNLDPEFKITKLMRHFKIDIPNLQDCRYFRRMRNSLITHKYKDKEETECRLIDDLFKEIIDFLQATLENEDGDNLYNCFIKSNMFHLHDDDEWQKRTIPKGMKYLIKILKSMIFDAYEVCLIRQLTNWKIRQQSKEALKEYYSFIHSFDNKPTFMEERDNDNKLLYNRHEHEYDNDSYSCTDIINILADIWKIVIKEMKDYKKNKNMTQLKQIISHHSDETIRTLDKNFIKELENTNFD